jgi:hypothetical protein
MYGYRQEFEGVGFGFRCSSFDLERHSIVLAGCRDVVTRRLYNYHLIFLLDHLFFPNIRLDLT